MDVNLISGGLHVDERGVVSFVNDFDFKEVDRFYTIKMHQTGVPRGWVGHKREHKWFTAFSGTIILGVVSIDNWENPASNLVVTKFILSSIKPSIIHVPPGHVTAIKTLDDSAILGVFSSGTIEDASTDDWRFDIGKWKL